MLKNPFFATRPLTLDANVVVMAREGERKKTAINANLVRIHDGFMSIVDFYQCV